MFFFVKKFVHCGGGVFLLRRGLHREREKSKIKSTRALLRTSAFGAAGRGRTGTVSLPMDFESITSAYSITAAYIGNGTIIL